MCRPTPQKKPGFWPVKPAACGTCSVLFTIPYVLSRAMPAACGGCGLCTGKPEAGSRKVDFLLLRCLHRPQAKSAEGWRRAGKR